MSSDSIDRTALGEFDADAWERNDPHSQETTAEPQTHGEYTWDEYAQAWVRVQEERKQGRESWGLRWLG